MTWHILRINKKGQTEDILADLIPAIIITVIAVLLLGKVSSEHRVSVDKTIEETKLQLLESAELDYLRLPVGVKGKCANPRLTTADIISKIDPTKAKNDKDSCYLLFLDITDNFNMEYMVEEELSPWLESLDYQACLSIELEFSENNEIFGSGPDCVATKQAQRMIALPLKNGEYVNIAFSKGKIGGGDED